jgi:putative ABC transport system permease protein
MIQSWKTAFKSLIAHRRKTWAIVASITLGISALILVGGYYEYNYWGLKQSLIRSQYAHLQIFPEGYRADRDIDPFSHSIENSGEIVSLLEKDPAVKAVSPRSRAWGLVNGKPVEIWGVEPEREAEIFTFTTSRRGKSLTGGDLNACQMSPALAREIGVELNDIVRLSGVRSDMQFNLIEASVQSLIGSYSEDFDRTVIFVPRQVFLDLFSSEQIHEIAVLYKNDTFIAGVRDRLQLSLASRGWRTDIMVWYEQAAYFRQVVEYYQGFYRIVLAVVAMIVFFATGTTMALSLLERTREFGTCLSMGAGRHTLVVGILSEAFIAGSIGLFSGAALSFAAALIINACGGIVMPAAPGMTSAIHVYIRFSVQSALLSLVTALVVPVAAVALPARRIMSGSIVRLLNKGEA